MGVVAVLFLEVKYLITGAFYGQSFDQKLIRNHT